MSETPEADRATVLVIDDKEVNLRLMRAYLQAQPYEVIAYSDPQAALDCIEHEPPDLILLDLMMPVLDGFAVLDRLKVLVPQVPVLVVTGVDDRDDRLRALESGARDYLIKPVDRSELLIRVRNLVALKQAGDALGRALAKLEAANLDLNAFAGALAHDLQQPITSIGAFAQVIQRNTANLLSPADASHLKRIVAAAQNAHHMVRGLLEFARLGQRQIEMVPVDLNVVVQKARNALGQESGTQAVSWTTAALPMVRGDPTLLQLAFVNLLSNAVKYSRTREQPSIVIDSPPDMSAGPVIRIRDNGVGFDMAHAQRLFHPFERLHNNTQFEGSGMGLANVRRIMERHGGSVRAESVEGEGATFTLLFRA